jgi:hypothetical protein
MPCPNPSLAAVEAGVFGFDENGVIAPTMDDVRALTAEHARELLCLLSDIDHLKSCARHGVDPVSSRAPRGDERRQSLIVRLERERRSLRDRYDDALAAYADGFGWEATEALDAFVKALREATPSRPSPLRQREMF